MRCSKLDRARDFEHEGARARLFGGPAQASRHAVVQIGYMKYAAATVIRTLVYRPDAARFARQAGSSPASSDPGHVPW